VLAVLLLGLRGAAAIAVLTSLVGGIPRIVQAALAVALGLWSALAVVQPGAAIEVTWQLAIAELAIGAALGVLAAVPLLAAAAAGRLVDLAGTGRVGGPYSSLFGVLAAAVFVGIDGHVAVIEAIVQSHRTTPLLAMTRDGVLAALAHLVPAAIRLAVPWLVTAAVVQVAAGVGTRLAGRAGAHVPGAAAVPAALVMMTATLVATLAVAMAAVMRGTL
jgi:flagellar biosynthesis protein FliR